MDSNKVLMIISICAIFSPIITCIFDNIFKTFLTQRHEIKTKKCDVVKEFIDATIECITYFSVDDNDEVRPNADNLKRYYKSSKALVLYFPKVDLEKLDKLNSQIATGNKNHIFQYLKSIIEELSEYTK